MQIFIGYSSKDRAIAEQIALRLLAETYRGS
jgi:hypothetical protein